MKLIFLTIESSKAGWYREVQEEYSEKIGRFAPFEILEVKTGKHSRDDRAQKKSEDSKALLGKIKATDFVILCDEKGRALDSIKFSNQLVRAFESGRQRVVVVIGGSYGVTEELVGRADFTWNLSPMTLNHHMAAVVVLEQLYRAMTIWKRIPYHNV